MKKATLLTVVLAVALAACGDDATAPVCNPGSEPSPPHGRPDDTSRYSSGEYRSLTYTYYCYTGKYLAYTYVRVEKCGNYHLDSKYESEGICY